jgi:hypothetical protein
LTAPKRFLKARSTRKRLPLSPSKYSTASTMCSSTRGPAMPPSLVTWPTRNTLVPAPWRSAPAARDSRTWLTEPGAAVQLLGPQRLDRVDRPISRGFSR